MVSRRGGAFVALLVALGAAPGCGPTGDLGTRVWSRKCSGCHGQDGEGRTKLARGRPYANLTDGVWKHGGDLESVRRLITRGDPSSPMPPYEGRLSAEEIDAVARHVLSLATPPRPRRDSSPPTSSPPAR